MQVVDFVALTDILEFRESRRHSGHAKGVVREITVVIIHDNSHPVEIGQG